MHAADRSWDMILRGQTGNIRTVADRNSNRTSYQSEAYSNPQTEVRARTPRTMVAESHTRQTSKSAYAHANKSGFVDWSGERVRCPNLQRAHGGYSQWFFRILMRHRNFNSVAGKPIYSRIVGVGFGNYRLLEEILDRLTYLRTVLQNSQLRTYYLTSVTFITLECS